VDQNGYSAILDDFVKSVNIQLNLRAFFAGEWLEWYAFMKIATQLSAGNHTFSCLKNAILQMPNGDTFEIDLFFLIDGKVPLWVECKSGEYRSAIGKYVEMRKRLKLDRANMFLLALEVPDDKVAALSSTFDTVIGNHHGVLEYVHTLVERG